MKLLVIISEEMNVIKKSRALKKLLMTLKNLKVECDNKRYGLKFIIQ